MTREILKDLRRWRGLVNRLADILVACLILAITLPLIVFVVVAIKVESGGPIFEVREFYWAGQRLKLHKFRTAARRPGVHKPFSPELTAVGRFLWQTRIEHLPQVINLLRGEISLVDFRASFRGGLGLPD